ncbi:MAG: acyl carrier protein [Bacteroidales bacterium]|nr:acyl carrier protein [Bacteroidales bacterium]
MTERLRDSKPKSSSSNSSSGSNSVVYRKVVEILCNNLGIDKDEIKSDSRLDSDLGADSLDAVEIIMEIESTFDIDVPDKVAQKLRTVGDIVTYIETHRKRF